MSELDLEYFEEFEPQFSFAVKARGRKLTRGNGLSPNILRSHVAREKPPEPVKPVIADVPARSQLTTQPAISVDFYDYPSMVEAFRAIKDHIAISNEDLDALCNFGRGHSDKLLGPTSVRGFARLSLDKMIWALAVKGTFTIDLERAKEMEQHWEKRCASNTRTKPNRISKKIIESVKPIVKSIVLSEMSKKGWETRRRNLNRNNPMKIEER